MNSPREGGDSADKTVLGLIIQMPKYKEVKIKIPSVSDFTASN